MTGLGRAVSRALALCVAMFAGWAALWLGAVHPVAPVAVLCGVLLAGLWSAWRPAAWLFWLPALLPVLNFAPWTGWTLFDESDLAVLAVLAGGHARLAWDGGARAPWPRHRVVVWLLLVATLVMGVWRGLADAGGGTLEGALPGALYGAHDSAWNTWRVAKSLCWLLLLTPLAGLAARQPGVDVARSLARGMVAGLTLVGLLVLWERAVYVGLLDFGRPYRTSAWFWEMHVGGGAIDAYLALAAPFAYWAVWTAPTAQRWVAANLLLWLTVHAVLTTYSRGVYLAVLVALLFMALAAWRLRIPSVAGRVWGARAMVAMLLALVLESALVFSGSFMGDRLSRAPLDMAGRVAHWRAGLALLETPSQWTWGLGLGRLPAHYAWQGPAGEFPGRATWLRGAGGGGSVWLEGPASRPALLGTYALTQRVDLRPGDEAPMQVRLQGQAPQNLAVLVSLCERHWLYEHRCRQQVLRLGPQGGEVQALLSGAAFDRFALSAQRSVVLSVTALGVGQGVRLDRVALLDAQGRQRLQNPSFTQGLAHWLPGAQGYFLPWHIDNLYLDVLIERGLAGLGVLALWVAGVAAAVWQGLRRGDHRSWVWAASLLGVLSLGLLISVTEIPRVALMIGILWWFAPQNCEAVDDGAGL